MLMTWHCCHGSRHLKTECSISCSIALSRILAAGGILLTDDRFCSDDAACCAMSEVTTIIATMAADAPENLTVSNETVQHLVPF